jgi:putative redox protein
MENGNQVVARVAGDAPFATRLEAGGASILADEPDDVGGGGAGPTPYQLVSAGLAACTSMTLRLYARGKDWTLPDFEVAVTHSVIETHPPQDRFDRRITFRAPVEAERLARLVEIADRCPVHRTLSRISEVVTSTDNAPLPCPPAAEHFEQMQSACDEEGA